MIRTPEMTNFTEAGYPIIEPQSVDIEEVNPIRFTYAKSMKDKNSWIHFFIQDFQFNRVWNTPRKYVNVLAEFNGVLSPDFSMFTDMPRPLQQFNHYRKQWCGAYWQAHNIPVIPTVSWADETSFDFCLEGIPKHNPIAVSSLGCLKNVDARRVFYKGYEKALDELEPTGIVLYCARSYVEDVKAVSRGIPIKLIEYVY